MEKVAFVGICGQSVFLKGKNIAKIGESCSFDEMHIELGGKGINSALTAHKLGGNISFFTAIGQDAYAVECKKFFHQEGMNVFLVEKEDVKTDYGVIMNDEDGNNCVAVYLDASSKLIGQDLAIFEHEIKASSYLVTQAEMNDEILLKIAQICKKSGTKIIFDPSPKRDFPKEFLESVWLFTPNETEYKNLFEQTTPHRVVVTKGGDSVELIENGEKTVFPVTKTLVRNTTGAGDVFNGALCYALSIGKTLLEAIPFAIKASAYKVQSLYVMDGIPTLEDVQ